MCIIQGEISSVSGTKICVIPYIDRETGKRMQVTIYENKVQLPIPVRVVRLPRWEGRRGGAAGAGPAGYSAPGVFAGTSSLEDFYAPVTYDGAGGQRFGGFGDGSVTGSQAVLPPVPVTDGVLGGAGTQQPVAMILPFPNGTTCRMIDLSGFPDVFTCMDDLFPTERIDPTFGMVMSANYSADRLEVRQVGSYKVSIVPSLDQFERLDLGVFRLAPDVERLLAEKYAGMGDFGFVVCQIDVGAAFHPVAYVHEMADAGMFIPTYHFHQKSHGDHMGDDGVHYIGFDRPRRRGASTAHAPEPEHADWDHRIYVFNADARFVRGVSARGIKVKIGYPEEVIHEFPFERIDRGIDIGRMKSVCKLKIGSSYNENHDFMVPAVAV